MGLDDDGVMDFLEIPERDVWLTPMTRGHRSLNLTKERIGRFVYHAIRLGGIIASTKTENPRHDRSPVQMLIYLPKQGGLREELERVSGIDLIGPDDEAENAW